MLREGVVKLVPLATFVVSAASLYQLTTSEALPLIDAVRVTVPVPHLAAPVPVGADGPGFTVAITVAAGPVQPDAFVSVT